MLRSLLVVLIVGIVLALLLLHFLPSRKPLRSPTWGIIQLVAGSLFLLWALRLLHLL